ncbi:MAG: DUF1501 domain-containing protein [Fuerstiella sp.]|nr:DUF1501 domain-containing protein [Fuerstiella sp.]MCP4853377.1 DUF1501 domain-containing protein [Fuerstiella sp.]
MLSVAGQTFRHCDGIARRSFLTAGALGFGGLGLADLLRAEQTVGIRTSQKSVINIHLDGGPSQLDTIDPKPEAPSEVRGEFHPIQTTLPGVQISELMPQVASLADQFVFIRSLVGSAGRHHAFQCQSGFDEKSLEAFGGRPAMGCVISKLLGSPGDVTPAFVDLMQGRPLVRNSARPGFLGPSFQPFRPDMSKRFPRELEAGMKNELARLGEDQTVSLKLNSALSHNRLDDRRTLLAGLDQIRREVDASGMMNAMDRFQQQAVGILTSGEFANAMDLSREDPATLARYTGPAASRGTQSTTSEGANSIQKFLLARRLVEAGVRCVSVSISDFDTHSSNFGRLRHLMPIVDHGLHTLVTDLQERGMLDDVTIVAWGEFGRTPRINSKDGGRDHWPQVGPALLAGGGMKNGQVIGSTDRIASTVVSRPVHYKDVVATLYRNLGLDARKITVADPQGRPQYVLDEGESLPEV